MTRWLWILIIPVIVILAYGSSVSSPFAYDDRIHILENDSVIHFQSVFDPDSLQRIREHAFGLSGRPLLFVTYGINYASSGAHPASFRQTNFVIHTINALLVLWIVFEIAGKFPSALIASALFAAHPLLTEGVTYI